MDTSYSKYLKYKMKYINLKAQVGGDLTDAKKIELLNNPNISLSTKVYLLETLKGNPIYTEEKLAEMITACKIVVLKQFFEEFVQKHCYMIFYYIEKYYYKYFGLYVINRLGLDSLFNITINPDIDVRRMDKRSLFDIKYAIKKEEDAKVKKYMEEVYMPLREYIIKPLGKNFVLQEEIFFKTFFDKIKEFKKLADETEYSDPASIEPYIYNNYIVDILLKNGLLKKKNDYSSRNKDVDGDMVYSIQIDRLAKLVKTIGKEANYKIFEDFFTKILILLDRKKNSIDDAEKKQIHNEIIGLLSHMDKVFSQIDLHLIDNFMIIEENVLFVYTLFKYFPSLIEGLEPKRNMQILSWYKLLDKFDKSQKGHSSNDPNLTPEQLKKKRKDTDKIILKLIEKDKDDVGSISYRGMSFFSLEYDNKIIEFERERLSRLNKFIEDYVFDIIFFLKYALGDTIKPEIRETMMKSVNDALTKFVKVELGEDDMMAYLNKVAMAKLAKL